MLLMADLEGIIVLDKLSINILLFDKVCEMKEIMRS